MNDKQIDLIAHSLGINYYNSKLSSNKKDKYLPDEFYRNYYHFGTFTDDMINLEKEELIEKFEAVGVTKLFRVTQKGILKFREIFQQEVTNKYIAVSVKESKSKSRYMDWLHNDSGLTFAEELGIYIPKREYGINGIRFTSTKYPSVKGEYKRTVKDAKESYKKALKEFKQSLKNNLDYVSI